MYPMHRLFSVVFMVMIALSLGCEPKSDVDHYAIAKEMESQLEGNPEYGDSAYENIAQELELVKTGDDTYAAAQAWLKEIREARYAALYRSNQAPEIQEGGAYPSKPAKGSGSKQKARGSMTAAGWMPYNDVPQNLGSGKGRSASKSSKSGSRSSKTAASSKKKCAKGPVTLYSTSWCGVCREARGYFRKKGISFIDKDIEKDQSAAAELKRKAPNATGVPVIDIGGEIIPGFSASAIERKMCL